MHIKKKKIGSAWLPGLACCGRLVSGPVRPGPDQGRERGAVGKIPNRLPPSSRRFRATARCAAATPVCCRRRWCSAGERRAHHLLSFCCGTASVRPLHGRRPPESPCEAAPRRRMQAGEGGSFVPPVVRPWRKTLHSRGWPVGLSRRCRSCTAATRFQAVGLDSAVVGARLLRRRRGLRWRGSNAPDYR